MNFDFHAHWGEELLSRIVAAPDEEEHKNDLVVKFLADNRNSDQDVLAALLELPLGESRPKKKLAGAAGRAWRKSRAELAVKEELAAIQKCLKPEIRLELLPRLSWSLDLEFKLHKDLITKDENPFYPIENPFRKDRAFGSPTFAASGWKGCLKSAFHAVHDETKDEIKNRLFGTASGDDGVQGRLWNFSSDFSKLSFAILNPHDRAKKIGMPIFVETVPAGTSSTYRLLYCPFDAASQVLIHPQDVAAKVADDLEAIATPILAMLTVLGFGAKTSSGFGTVVLESIKGNLRINMPATAAPQPAQPAQPSMPLPRYLKSWDELQPQYLTEGQFKEINPTTLDTMPKRDRQDYHKAKNWWDHPENRQRPQPLKVSPQPIAVLPPFSIDGPNFEDAFYKACAVLRAVRVNAG